MKKILKDWIPSILIAIVLSFILQTFVAQAVTIPSESMVPTLEVNDRLIINKMIDPGNLKYGDIVVFHSPLEDKNERYIKRLMGKGGDIIEIKGGHLYRTGLKIEEPYLAEPIEYDFGPVEVPRGHFFFLGDNRNRSYDSHLWSTPFVSSDRIIGKAVFRYFPLGRINRI